MLQTELDCSLGKVGQKLSAARAEVDRFKSKVEDVMQEMQSIEEGLQKSELKLQLLEESKEDVPEEKVVVEGVQ